MCVMCRVEGRQKGFNLCMDEDSRNFQTTKEGSKSILLIAALWRAFVPQTER